MAEIRLFRAAEWRLYRDIRLASLLDAPDAFGTTFDQSSAYSDDTWRSRLEDVDLSKNYPVAAFVGNRPVALAWGRLDPDDMNTIILNQMWTQPAHRGKGLAAELVRAVIGWANSLSAQSVLLSVTVGNDAAKQLYLGLGFAPTGETEPLRPGAPIDVEEMRLPLR